MSGREFVLEVENLTVWFGDGQNAVPVVRGIDLQLEARTTLGIVGESGSGKSLAALAMMGLLPPQARFSGTVRLAGRPVEAHSEWQWRAVRGREIAMVFQNPMNALNPVLTIGEQLIEAVRAHQTLTFGQARAVAASLLDEVRLANPRQQLKAYPHELSGGMRQRVMIAIAMANRPRVLIADEPTTALDASVRNGILDLLQEIQLRTAMAIILVTHDLDVVRHRADRVAVMYAGKVVEEHQSTDLIENPRHPYTRALIGARPTRRPRNGQRPKLIDIPGQVPAPGNVLSYGCAFAPRCSTAIPVCSRVTPPISGFKLDRVACHLPVAAE